MRAPLKFSNGFTESAWKSLVVKSLRIGWLAGLQEAQKNLPPSTFRSLLLSGVFEDVFPATSELQEVLEELCYLNLEALCSRETLHGRGFAEAYCDTPLAGEEARPRLREEARSLGIQQLPFSAFENFNAWLLIKPEDPGCRREVDLTPWTGMPWMILDSHTVEGGWRREKMTLVSGHCENHRFLGKMVMQAGWSTIRELLHAGDKVEPRGAMPKPVEVLPATSSRSTTKWSCSQAEGHFSSSWIEAVAYDETGYLLITNRGEVYKYHADEELAAKMLAVIDSGESVGKFFHRNLRNREERKAS